MQKYLHLPIYTFLPLHTIFVFFAVFCKTYYQKPMLLLTPHPPPPTLLTRLGAQKTSQPLLFLLILSSLLWQPTSPITLHQPSNISDSFYSSWVIWLDIVIRVCWFRLLEILPRWTNHDPVPSTMGAWQHWYFVTIFVFIPTINKTVT